MRKQQIKQFTHKTYRVFLILVSLTCMETLFFLQRYLAVKSEPASSLLWGYSGVRLGIIAVLSLALLACLTLIVFTLRARERVQNIIATFLERERLQQWLLRGLLLVFVPLFFFVTFEPASFSRYQPHFTQIRTLFIWLTLAWAQIVALEIYVSRLTFLELTGKQIVFILLSIFLVGVWFFLRRDMIGRPSTSWMSYYHAIDFLEATPREILAFFKEMRSGIPPLLSLLEIVNVKVFGSTKIITNELYRLALLVSYCLAVWLFSKRIVNAVASFVLALIFLPATVFISAQNPEIYDVYFPCFVLMFLFFDQLTRECAKNRTLRVLSAFISGLFLSFAELSRPFVLVFIPIILMYIYLAYRPLPKKVLIAFLIPLLLISASWHAKLLVFNNGQIFWSNHGGFNFYRAWGDIIDMPELVEEPQTWDNRSQIHTQEHYENGKRIQSAVLKYVLTHPLDSIPRIVERMGALLRPRLTLFDQPEPQDIFAWVYRIAFYAAFLFFLIQLMCLLIDFIANPSLQLFANPQHVLLIVIGASIAILALAEKGEEARLLLAVLPLLAALPQFEPVKTVAKPKS